MKQILLTIWLSLTATLAWGAKANPSPMTFVQSDGTSITVLLHGDEHFSWFSTADGVLLARQGNDFHVATVQADGTLSASGIIAHMPALRTAEETTLIGKQDQKAFFSEEADRTRLQTRRQTSIGTATPSYFPHTGSPTAIVILVNYQDTQFSVANPMATFTQYLNGDEQTELGNGESQNYGSVKKYFHDMSFGAFTPQFEVVGPVTVSKTMDYYGQDSGSTKDIYCSEMVKEACTLAAQQIDFMDEKYDADGDGCIDLVYVIYAGYGQSNGAPAGTIWPKSAVGNLGTFGGKTVRRYGVNNELYGKPENYVDKTPQVNGIGLFCHEFSHCMGLPDLYPYSASAQVDNQEMEYWSIMDGGEYVKNGYYPAAYTAWEREAFGWLELTTLSTDETITARPVLENGNAYRMVNPKNSNECIIMENIQKNGWNTYMPGHGLIAYHVKYPYSVINMSDRPNDTAGEPGFALIPADGLLASYYNIGKSRPWGTGTDNMVTAADYLRQHYGDPFPGTGNVTGLNDDMELPNFRWYTATKGVYDRVDMGLKDITEDTDNGTVTFDFIANTTGIESVRPDRQPVKGTYFTTDGRRAGTDRTRLQKGVYILDGRKVVVR